MKYSMIIQHTTTKEFYVYNIENIGPKASIYYKFEITLNEDLRDGEYEYIVFENDDQREILVNVNNIFDSKDDAIVVSFDGILTNNLNILLANNPLVLVSSGLLRIGDYDTSTIQYDKPNKYAVYERK